MKPSWLRIFFRELADKWQIPSLVFALLLVGSGLYFIFSRQEAHSREEDMSLCQTLATAGQHRKAAEFALALVDDPKITVEQRRILYGILCRSLHQIELSRPKHNPPTLQAIQNYIKESVADRPFNAQEHLLWADTYEWQGNISSAIKHLRNVLETDYAGRVAVLRRILELLPRTHQADQAGYVETLEQLLHEPSLGGTDLVWAAGRKAEFLFQEGRFAEAVELIEGILPRVNDENDRLELEYALAFGEYSRHQIDAAEPALRSLLSRITKRGELDAKANLLLAKICLQDDRPEEALVLFDSIISWYVHKDYEVAAHLGRAEALASLHRFQASLEAYRRAFETLGLLGPNRFVSAGQILSSLESVSLAFEQQGKLDQALTFAELQYRFLENKDIPERITVLKRLSQWHRDLAGRQAEELVKVESPEFAESLRNEILVHYRTAAEYFLALSNSPGLRDRESAEALWEAALCYQLAPESAKAVETLEKLVRDWPNDGHHPEALFRLAKSHQDRGQPGRAVESYRKLLSEYQRTPWGLSSLVPIAQCYMAMGPEYYPQAESVLRGVVDDTAKQELVTPEAREFRESLFLLGKLYYHQGDFEACAARLEEALGRYSTFPRECAEARFLIAQSCRELAERYARQVDQTNDQKYKTTLYRNRQENLLRAADLYSETIEAFDKLPQTSELEQTYLKLALIWRADCLYDLRQYEQAVEVYEDVVDRYETSSVALAAYVQIINAYQRLGQPAKIKAVLERMKWQIQQLPDSAFEGPGTGLSRQEWQKWIEWNFQSGLLGGLSDTGMVRGPGSPDF
jgi:tetratricopeptide (TPR) repeat protein